MFSLTMKIIPFIYNRSYTRASYPLFYHQAYNFELILIIDDFEYFEMYKSTKINYKIINIIQPYFLCYVTLKIFCKFANIYYT